MGILNANKLINNLDAPFTKRTFNNFVHENRGKIVKVDMLANFYPWLLNSELAFLKKQFVEWFAGEGKENVELVFDGKRTIQKLNTAVERATKKHEDSLSLLEKANAIVKREQGARIKAQIKR